jgi:hypothetical protein
VLAALAATACLAPPLAQGRSEPGGAEKGAGALAPSPYRWRSVVIQGGGFVTGIVFSPAKPGVAYARTDIGGAYRFNPADKSWVPLTDFLGKADANYFGVESLAADPADASHVYMAVGLYTQSWAGPGAFMRSSDRGNTWQIIPTPGLKMGGNEDGRSNGERLAVDPNQTEILYFGSRRSGLWKSTDQASTWSRVDGFPVKDDPNGLGIPFVVFDKKSGVRGQATPIIYAGASKTDTSLYRSTDAGQTWQPVPKQPSGFMPSHAEFDQNGVLYLSYGSGPGPYNVPDGAVYRYDPKTDTWADISPLKPGGALPGGGVDKFGYGALSVDASRPGTLLASTIDRWAGGGEIFRTADGGQHWKPLMAQAVLADGGAPYVYGHQKKIPAPQWVGDIAVDPFNPSHAMLVTGAGIWASEDVTAADRDRPTHWVFRNRNLEETAVLDMVSPPAGPPLLTALGDLCGFRHDRLDVSPTRGTFDNPVCANSTSLDFAQSRPNLVVRVGSYPWDGSKGARGSVSLDGGATWTEFRSEPAGSDGSGSVAISADGSSVLWAARKARAAFSKNQGTSWTAVSGLPEPAKIADWAPLNLKLVADRANPKKFYAFDALTGTAYSSSDAGEHFQLTTSGLPSLPDYDLTPASIRAVSGIEGDVWITSGKQLSHSTDSGTSYTPVRGVEAAYGLGFGRALPGHEYPAIYLSGKVAGVTGLFRSDDGGKNFVRINDDAHQYGGSTLIIGDPRVYGRVYVAGHGRGVLVGEPK